MIDMSIRLCRCDQLLYFRTHAHHELFAMAVIVFHSADGRPEANDNPARTHAPAMLRQHIVRALDPRGHDLDVRLQRQDERALLEWLQRAVLGARALGINDHDAVVLAHERARLLERCYRAHGVRAIDGYMSCGSPRLPPERDLAQLLLRNEAESFGNDC